MKSLFTHISLIGCNPSPISRLLSLLTIQIPSSPFPSSSPVSLCSAPPHPAPQSPPLTHCLFPSISSPLIYYFSPPPFTLLVPLCVSCVVLITLLFIHEDLKVGVGLKWEGVSGQMMRGREGNGGVGCVGGACHRIIKHRFGTMVKTATRCQTRRLWVGQPMAFC